jgi:predicted transcriptional regulator of viral defense system
MPDERCVFHSWAEKRSAHPDLDRRVAELAERQHGVVARRQLFASGLGRGAIDARLKRGQLYAVHRGVYSVGHRLLSREGKWMAAVLACGDEAVLSHRSAGELWRIVSPRQGWPEVTRSTAHRVRVGIVIHRGTLAPDEVDVVDGIPVTSVHRTIFDLAAASRRRDVERAMREAEVRGLTDRLSFPDLLERHPGARGAATIRELVASKDPGGVTRNEFEEGFVAFLDIHGLPRPAFNAPLAVRGRFFVIDALWRDRRLAVELDGRATHGTAAAFESDRERDRILQTEGWRTARITWRQLNDDSQALAADLRRLLGTL